MTKVYRDYRNGYMTVYPEYAPAHGEIPDLTTGVSMYVGSSGQIGGIFRQWSVDNGYSHETLNGTDFGFAIEGGRVRGGRLFRCFKELRDKQRETWSQEARDTCHRLERKLYETFEGLDEATDAKEKLTRDVSQLKSSLAEAQRVAVSAEQTAAEMKRRAKDSDPARIRREVETESAVRIAQLEQANQALAAKLAETESQMTKLAEDKKRLRIALNGARAGR